MLDSDAHAWVSLLLRNRLESIRLYPSDSLRSESSIEDSSDSSTESSKSMVESSNKNTLKHHHLIHLLNKLLQALNLIQALPQ